MATVTAGGSTLPTIQRGLVPIEREEALVGTPLPMPVQEAVDAPSPATRFLSLLHEELRPSSSGDPNTLLLLLITQESLIRIIPSIDPNDLESEPVELTYPAPLAFSAVARGSLDQEEEPKIKFLCTITRDGWSPHPEVVVKREREEEQVPEEVPRKKQRVQKRKLLLWKSIHRANLRDPRPDEKISQVTLRPKQILRHPSRYTS